MQNPNYGAPPSFGAYSTNASDAEGDLPTSLPSYMPPTQQPPPPQHQQHQQAPPGMPFAFSHLAMGGGGGSAAPGAKSDDIQAQFATASISGGVAARESMQNSAKRQAPQGQWKTPPHYLFTANPSAGIPEQPATGGARQPPSVSKSSRNPRGGNGQPSPSTGLRGMSFQDAPMATSASAMAAAQAAYAASSTNYNSSGDEKRPPPPTEIAGISAAQFAASTGGLTMDATLLARVSGTDPSLVGSEQIKQIMQCPDLLSIYQKLQEEDDRRQRRLERNRASARVRREKKKSMVDTYEGEVSKLENSLNLLRAHSFGAGQEQDLKSALEYSGGEHLRHATMSKGSKTELLGRILGQHSQNTAAIRKANLENQVLIAAASENSELFNTLRIQLRLSDEQCRHLQSMAQRTRDETRKLDAIAKCFSALRAHDWLYFPGIETLLHQTRHTMTQQQFQRFLTWTADNDDVVEQLPIMPATSAAAQDADSHHEFHFAED